MGVSDQSQPIKSGGESVTEQAEVSERVARCNLIARVLGADGVITDEERAFLEKAMRNLGLDEKERRLALSEQIANDADALVKEMPAAMIHDLLDDLVAAARADGVLNEYEMRLVRRLSKSLRDLD